MPSRWVVAAGAALLLVLAVVAARGDGGEEERIRHLQALLPIPEGAPPGWFSLEFADGSLELMGPTGTIETIGEVARFSGGKLELGPNPRCDRATSGGLYDVDRDGGTVTFEAVGPDGCPPRQQLLTAGPWTTYTPPPMTTDLPAARPAEVAATVPLPGAADLALDDGSVWAALVGSTEIARIDRTTDSVAGTVDVGYTEQVPGLAAGDGAVWLTSWLRSTVTRIDAGAGRVAARIPVGRNPSGGLLASGDDMWVANGGDGTVSRIAAATGRVTRTVAVAQAGIGVPQDVVAFGGRVLVSVPQDGQIAQIEPPTEKVSSFYTGRVTSRLATTPDAVWAVEGGNAGWVTRIGADGVPELRVGVGQGRRPQVLAASGEVLWVVTVGGDSPAADVELLRIDADTGEVVQRSAVWHPTQRLEIAVDDTGDVWLTTVDAVLRVAATEVGAGG
ncbi:hypothetical protein [Blastococcus sp. PRF04-17]|uniref:hypothetical protein n=1 Tax=Blastococcus sp. PRF04-17 TaxID=2933797 RepID=UPI001FF4E74E|nr:hypothetical protein [Blastococcus sp. PRF04-17]UOY03334.1 hypothetical protein MVA48_08355 [Blastococcus sp. PRF04-17]